MNRESQAAHTWIAPTKARTYARILDYAEQRGSSGLIVDELAEAWNCSHNHVAPRVGELVRAGKLIATGGRRRTRSGCSAAVVIAKRFTQQLRADPPAPAEDYRLFPDDVPPRHLDLG